METIYILMRKIGLRSTYSGYNYLATAIYLTLNNSIYLKRITKNLYVTIGQQYNVSAQSVEAAIRTLINSYWNQHSDRILSQLLGYSIYYKPTSSEFISILTDYLRDHSNYNEDSGI